MKNLELHYWKHGEKATIVIRLKLISNSLMALFQFMMKSNKLHELVDMTAKFISRYD